MYMQMTQCERTIIYPEAMTSFGGVNKIKKMKRTCVHVMPRASLCTITSMCGAFALSVVSALRLGELI